MKNSVVDRVLSPDYFPSSKRAEADYCLIRGIAMNMGIKPGENGSNFPVKLERPFPLIDSFNLYYFPQGYILYLVKTIQEAMKKRDYLEKRRRVSLALQKISNRFVEVEDWDEELRHRADLENSRSLESSLEDVACIS